MLHTFIVPIELYEALKKDDEFKQSGFRNTSYEVFAKRYNWVIEKENNG